MQPRQESSPAPPRRGSAAARIALLALAAALGALLLAPAPAAAADLFPVDDWIGDGAKELKDVAFGAVSFGVEEIGGLIVNLIAALVDLLVPESLVKQGMKAVRWLVSVPVFGDVPARGGGIDPSFPHLGQLRDSLTWIGITLLPLAIIVTVARGWIDPRLDADPPEQIILRIISAGVLLALYDTVWYAVTRLTGLITGAILSLPWVAQGTKQMLDFLLIGGAGGAVVAAEFIVPLLMLFAAIAFLGVLLLKVGLTVLAAVLYASGGLVIGLSPSAIGRRLLSAWAIALGSIAVIPVLWAIIFAAASALTLDAASPTDAASAGAPKLISQLFLGAAALAAFWMALSVGRAALGTARSAISSLSGPGAAGGGGRPAAAAQGAVATKLRAPAQLQSFARNIRTPAAAAATGALSGAAQLAGAAVGRRRPGPPASGAAHSPTSDDGRGRPQRPAQRRSSSPSGQPGERSRTQPDPPTGARTSRKRARRGASPQRVGGAGPARPAQAPARTPGSRRPAGPPSAATSPPPTSGARPAQPAAAPSRPAPSSAPPARPPSGEPRASASNRPRASAPRKPRKKGS